MTSGSIRRAQLVSPFGVGSMSVLVDGTSVITAGLDHWYETPEGRPDNLDINEYEEHDWRLEARLQVGGFRLPPDYRPSGNGSDNRNIKLTVPVLRFPRWHFCIYCKRLELRPLTMRQAVECPDGQHESRSRRPRMSQVPFVAICARGHLDDFPFSEWVHRSHNPGCTGPLRLVSRGGGGLEGQVVLCDRCDKNGRSLRGITESSAHTRDGEERTRLTNELVSEDSPHFCSGARPWLAETEGECSEAVRGALRAAGNVYFPKVESSLFLPQGDGSATERILELIQLPQVDLVMRTAHSFAGEQVKPEQIRGQLPELLAPVSDDELMAGFRQLLGIGKSGAAPVEPAGSQVLSSDATWRHPEYGFLRATTDSPHLKTSDPSVPPLLELHLDRIRSVEELRETRALRGFTRVRDGGLGLGEDKALLRRQPHRQQGSDWLPAYVVKGEGIYIELDQNRLGAWESQARVKTRATRIAYRYRDTAAARGLPERELSPRFIMLHTLGHLLVNELVFTCGYSSASLRERLYVSEAPHRQMAGLLIYTAAGDSEGTMGGLVRMARPENLRPVFAGALSEARWCSTDPVCMEVGEQGQGPDSCNLAACHGCALLPETSCEEFNRFLDRGLVIGTFEDPGLGYFSDLEH